MRRITNLGSNMNQTHSPIELRLTDICRWHDVERGWLQLTVGNRQRRWNAIWQTNLRFRSQGDNLLPRGTLPLNYRTTGKWIDCPRLKLNRRTAMWMVPLETARWSGFGVDLYLCAGDDEIVPLPRQDYLQLVDALKWYGIRDLTVDVPQRTVDGYLLNTEDETGFDADFWKHSE